jgi:hypothetical protein
MKKWWKSVRNVKAKERRKKTGVKRGLCVFQRKKKAKKSVITRRFPHQNHRRAQNFS